MYDIPRVIQNVVENLSSKIEFNTLTESSSVYSVLTKDTKYITKHRYLYINTNKLAKVTSVTENVGFSFIFIDVAPLTITSINIKPFKFFHGTTLMTNAERDSIKDYKDKLPFVWLFSVYDEVEIRDELSAFEKTANIRLFILDESEFENWLHVEHRNNVILPLKNYKEEFISALDKRLEVNKIEDITISEHANWGVLVKNGHVNKIFSDDLSGLELSFEIKMAREKCKC
jgi:hypothetical protein